MKGIFNMGKQKRKRKSTVYSSYEGHREGLFLEFLINLYQTNEKDISITSNHSRGGNPDSIVNFALKNNDRDKVFAWFDEDFEPRNPLSKETKESLAKCWNISKKQMDSFYDCKLGNIQSIYNKEKRKPILIVSQPVCVEALILKALGHKLPFEKYDHQQHDRQIKQLQRYLRRSHQKSR